MRILFKQFLSQNHSWSFVGQSLAKTFIKQGHQVDLFSTNGLKWFPKELESNLIGYVEEGANTVVGRLPDNNYDINISYTFLRNFQHHLSHSKKNRFGIWCYEWENLPVGSAKYYNNCDLILAPSKFAKHCFINSKIPENKVIIIPHGINLEDFENKNKYKLKTKKFKKILVNIGQAHKRKNIKGMFEAYFKAFTNKDDVCLVAKISKNKMQFPFDVDPVKIFNDFKDKYKNGPEVELITEYVPNMIELYNSCDVVYSLSHCEGFGMTMTEALAAGKINVCPRYGGQLDFLNDKNSLLVEGSLSRAPREEQYWGGHPDNLHFESNIDDAVNKLRLSINNTEALTNEYFLYNKNILPNYTWNIIGKKIMELVK